jgi:hypothetical protein
VDLNCYRSLAPRLHSTVVAVANFSVMYARDLHALIDIYCMLAQALGYTIDNEAIFIIISCMR